MDIDSIQQCQSSEVIETPLAEQNVNNVDRVVLPGNRINWNRVTNVSSFMIAFRCVKVADNERLLLKIMRTLCCNEVISKSHLWHSFHASKDGLIPLYTKKVGRGIRALYLCG